MFHFGYRFLVKEVLCNKARNLGIFQGATQLLPRTLLTDNRQLLMHLN